MMSGRAKKWLAILAATGITASGITDLLNHLMSAFPNPKLHLVCSAIITLIGIAVAVFPVSIKAPDETAAQVLARMRKSEGDVTVPPAGPGGSSGNTTIRAWTGDDDSPRDSFVKVGLVLGLAGMLAAGCGTAQRDTMLSEMALAKALSIGYRAVDGIDKAKTDQLHAEILAGQALQARTEYAAYKPKIDKAVDGLDAGEDLVEAADKARQAAAKGAVDWKTYTDYLPQLAEAAARVEALIADLKAVVQ